VERLLAFSFYRISSTFETFCHYFRHVCSKEPFLNLIFGHPRPATGKVVFPGWDGKFLISGRKRETSNGENPWYSPYKYHPERNYCLQ